jgi:hypothetical protein
LMKPLCYLFAPCLSLCLLGLVAAQAADCVAEKPLRLINLDDRHELVFHMPKERLAFYTAIGRFLFGPYPLMLRMQRAAKFYNYSLSTRNNPIGPPAKMGWYSHPIIDQCIDSKTVSLSSPPKLESSTQSACRASELTEIPYWKTEFKFYVLAEEAGRTFGLYISRLDWYPRLWKPEEKSTSLLDTDALGSKLAEQIQSLEQLSEALPPGYKDQASQLLAYFKRRYESRLLLRKHLDVLQPPTDIHYSFATPNNRGFISNLTQLRKLLEADLPANLTDDANEFNRMVAFEIQLANAGDQLPNLEPKVKDRAKTANMDNLRIALKHLQRIPFNSPDVLKEANASLSTYRECVDAFEQAQTADMQTPSEYVNLWVTMSTRCDNFEHARSRYRELLLSKL